MSGVYKKSLKTLSYIFIYPSTRAGEPSNFLAAPAPDFFPKRLRLLVFFSGSGSKEPKTLGSDRLRLRLPSSVLSYTFKYPSTSDMVVSTEARGSTPSGDEGLSSAARILFSFAFLLSSTG